MILQVSELTAQIKSLLEEKIPFVSVEGELSNFRPSSTGHWYFSLKDNNAVLPCVMFRGANKDLKFTPQDGDLLTVDGSISVYARRGTYQMVVQRMRRTGIGNILAQLEERKKQFAAERLFENKRPLPLFPQRIAVITSPTGAAVRDVITVLQNRKSPVNVLIIPVPVQGKEAGAMIAQRIRYVSYHRPADVLLVTRGGGSIEDMLPFSEEAVVRAIAASTIPVVSAVGHEIDWVLSDFAADMRAPTPSAAAEMISAGSHEITERVHNAGKEIVHTLLHILHTYKQSMKKFTIEELQYFYRIFMQPYYQQVDDAVQMLQTGIETFLTNLKQRAILAAEYIKTASPYATLQRGYAIIHEEKNDIVLERASQVKNAKDLSIQFYDGFVPVTHVQRDS